MKHLFTKKMDRSYDDVKGYICMDCNSGCHYTCVIGCADACSTVCGTSCKLNCAIGAGLVAMDTPLK